jgi:hypothetical protein
VGFGLAIRPSSKSALRLQECLKVWSMPGEGWVAVGTVEALMGVPRISQLRSPADQPSYVPAMIRTTPSCTAPQPSHRILSVDALGSYPVGRVHGSIWIDEEIQLCPWRPQVESISASNQTQA